MTHDIVCEFVRKLVDEKIANMQRPCHILKKDLIQKAATLENYDYESFMQILRDLVKNKRLIVGPTCNDLYFSYKKENGDV